MALPFSAMHDNMAACKAFSSEDEVVDELTRPFAALRSRMERNDNGPDK